MNPIAFEYAFAVFVICTIMIIVGVAWRMNPKRKLWSIRLIGLIAMIAIVGGILISFGVNPLALLGSALVATIFCLQLFRLVVCDQCGGVRFSDHDINSTEVHDADCPIVLRHQHARMIEPHSIGDDLRQQAPEGFRVVSWSNHLIELEHHRAGMGSWAAILIVFAIAFSILPVLFLADSFEWIDLDPDEPPMPVTALAPAWPVVAAIILWLVVSVFCKKKFQFDVDAIEMTTSLFGVSRRLRIPKMEIVRIAQVNLGGDQRSDAAPNWALRVNAQRRFWLLRKLPYEQTEWLGKVVARWADEPVRLLRNTDAPESALDDPVPTE